MNGRARRSRTLRTAVAAVAALAAATLAVAAGSRDSGGTRIVLHERVAGLAAFRWDPDDARPDPATRRPVDGPDLAPAAPAGPLDTGEPATMATDDAAGPGGFPAVVPPEPGDEIAVPPAPAGRVSDRPSDSFAPDLATDSRSLPDPTVPPGILWNPAPGPYLRQQVFDTVRDDGTLAVPPAAGPGLRDLEPPTGTAGHERFLGRARLEVRDRAPVRLPSPAPEFRAAISAGALDGDRLAVDRAGNLFLVPGPTPGPRELILSLETDARAFGGPLDPAARLADVPPALRPSFPAPLESSVRRVADALGLSADLPVETLLRLLATHFRSYVPGPPPAWRSGTAYEQLALGGVGLCRHRAYAFVVTAQALGLPVRMPVSRLHAWVEALVPVADRSGRRWLWRRIDLGGAYGAPDETLADIPAHVPELPDPFGWPRGARPTATGVLPGPGPAPAATATGPGTTPDPPTAGAEAPPPATSAPPAPTPLPSATAAPSGPAPAPPGRPGSPAPTAATAPALPPAAVAPPARPALLPAALERFPLDATRGETVEVSGRAEGGAPPGALVQIVLERPDGERRELGALALTRNGRFGGRVAVPADVPPGDYALRAYLLPW